MNNKFFIIKVTLLIMVTFIFFKTSVAQNIFNTIRINNQTYIDFSNKLPEVKKNDQSCILYDNNGNVILSSKDYSIVDYKGNAIINLSNSHIVFSYVSYSEYIGEYEKYYLACVVDDTDKNLNRVFYLKILYIEGNSTIGYKVEIIKDQKGNFAHGVYKYFYVYNETLYFMYFDEDLKQLVINKIVDKTITPISYFDFPMIKYYNNWDYSIAFSPDLKKLIISNADNFYIMDFNAKTAQLSNLRKMTIDYLRHFALSECGEYIFFLTYSPIIDYDYRNFYILRSSIDNVDSPKFDTISTIKRLYNSESDIILAPNGNIYICEIKHQYLHSIQNTDSTKCEFIENAIDLNGEKGPRYFPKTFLPSFNFDVQKQCNDVIIEYIGYPIESVEWDFGDDSKKIFGTNVSHQYSLPGNYTITMTANLKDGTKKIVKKNVSISNLVKKPIVRWK